MGHSRRKPLIFQGRGQRCLAALGACGRFPGIRRNRKRKRVRIPAIVEAIGIEVCEGGIQIKFDLVEGIFLLRLAVAIQIVAIPRMHEQRGDRAAARLARQNERPGDCDGSVGRFKDFFGKRCSRMNPQAVVRLANKQGDLIRKLRATFHVLSVQKEPIL